MNDTELNAVLDRIHADLRGSPAPSSLHERVSTIPFTTPQERGLPPRLDLGRFHMFSAVKFIAAGVIVALFGGFLLAGVLTTPQSDEMAPAAVTEPPTPMTSEELLSGMVTEEVEPGVHRVVHDGVRELKPYLTHVMETESPSNFAGADGSYWVGNTPLGGEEVELPDGWGPIDFVTADGTLWAAHWSYDGERWTPHPPPVEHAEWHSRDGVVLIAWLVEPPEDEHERDIVAAERSWIAARLDGEEWQLTDPITVPGTVLDDTWHEFYATDDGTIWTETGSTLSRWHDGEWIEDESASLDWEDHVAPDGSLWEANDPDWDWEGEPCLDMVRSYGLLEERFLTDVCPDHVEFDVGPDGAVWALAHSASAEGPRWDLYVITPAAMAAFEQPAASARTNLLPGVTLTVEEFEPGVFRVLDDGVRDVSSRDGELIAGGDGSIWLVSEEDFVRLGYPAEPWQNWPGTSQPTAFRVANDGTVWLLDGHPAGGGMDAMRLSSYEDGAWTAHLEGIDWFGPWTIALDGTVWAAYPAENEGEGWVVARLGTDGWEPLEGVPPGEAYGISVTSSGEVWIADEDRLWRYREDEGGWQELVVDTVGLDIDFTEAMVLDDGTIWVADKEALLAAGGPVLDEKGRPEEGDPFVMHFDGTGWQRWGSADDLPTALTTEGKILCCGLAPAPGDALWVSYATKEHPEGWHRNQLGWWDGSNWQSFLSERDIGSSAVAPDGSLWAMTDRGLYVITPEAVAATE